MDQLGGLVLGLVTIALVLTIGFLILAEANTQIQAIDGINSSGQNSSGDFIGSSAFNATRTTTNAIQTIPAWLPIVVVTIVGGILLSLVAVFRGKR